MQTFDYGLYKPSETLLIVIDVQEKLTPVISEEAELIKNVNTLLRGAEILGIPVLVTEQYPKGLGHTDKRIDFGNLGGFGNAGDKCSGHSEKNRASLTVLEKTSFSIFGNAEIVDFIAQLNAQGGAKNLIICGIESHICVLASVLHALEYPLESSVANKGVKKFTVWVAQDALSSRKIANHLNAIELMRSKGAQISCVESLLFGAMLESKSECFKRISELIK